MGKFVVLSPAGIRPIFPLQPRDNLAGIGFHSRSGSAGQNNAYYNARGAAQSIVTPT
jgi:hypothetical protein